MNKLSNCTFLLLLLILSGCYNEPAEAVTVSSGTSPTPSALQETDTDLISTFLCTETTLNNKDYKICLSNKSSIDSSTSSNRVILSPDIVCQVFTKANNKWKIESNHPILKDDGSLATFSKDLEVINIGQKNYLYFIYSIASMGNASGGYEELKFTLFSLEDHKLSALYYEGLPVLDEKGNSRGLKGEFTNVQKFGDKTEILNFLYTKAGASDLIFHPSEKDLDMCLAANYEEQWLMDNDINSNSLNKNNSAKSLKTTYYDESIFPGKDEGSFTETENERYKIVSLFRNNILGYDKFQKKYFPIWIESCAHGCEKSVSFAKESVLKIVYSESNDQSITVDLEKMTYRISSK